ncbi:MAG: acyl-CoA dehydrogenase family protein [Novosphingobium sp.]|nr:acyl-CoA dehydrogenase family protein [Novosphingobium sp.]
MDLSLSSDQIAVLDALDSLAKPYEAAPLHGTGFALTDPGLDRALAGGGFLDVGFDPDLGIATAGLVVERLARLPQASEAASSAIVRPLLGDGVGSPLCMVEEDKLLRPVRFLREGATVVVAGRSVTSFVATAGQVRAEPEALFGYPVATLLSLPEARTDHAVDAALLRTHWRIALAAESAGLLAAALASVCAHTTERQQFGRPLASFQGLRHRLAEAQVRTNGVYWLAMKAAATLDPADAALAALHAQETARAVVYDFHQFMGAMGMTLEHPLHLWTYRLKLLAGELGGRGGNALAAAETLWGSA